MTRSRAGKVNMPVLLVGLAGIAVLVGVLASGFGNDPRAVPSVLEGKAAPTFTLQDLEGNPVDLADYRGKTVVVNFWSSWCLPCKQEHLVLQRTAELRKDVQFFGIIYSDDEQKARRYLKQRGSSYPNLLDPGQRTAIDYGVAGVPETFFINPDGTIRHKQVGPVDMPLLASLLGGPR